MEKYCPKCGDKKYIDSAKFCGKCGEPLAERNNNCNWCGKSIHIGFDKYCPGCGRKEHDALHTAPPKKEPETLSFFRRIKKKLS